MSTPERVCESWSVSYARKLAYQTRKMNGLGARSWPDQFFATWGGICFFIEFKREGEEPTPKQAEMHRQLRELGHTVHVVTQKAEAKRIIDEAWARGRAIWKETKRADQAKGPHPRDDNEPHRARGSGRRSPRPGVPHHDPRGRRVADRHHRPHA